MSLHVLGVQHLALILDVHVIAELGLLVRPVDLGMNLTDRRRHVARKLLCIAALDWVIVVLSPRTPVSNLREIRLTIELPTLTIVI